MISFMVRLSNILFQPTLPLRGATLMGHGSAPGPHWFQPTLPLRGATRQGDGLSDSALVSTHAPLAGSDITFTEIISICEFQPTLPLRGATTTCAVFSSRPQSFNPRSPCGERL